MKTSLSILMLLLSHSAFAYKMVIYTDEPDSVKAKEVESTFKKTYPFNQFEIEIEIKSVSAEVLACAPTNADGRLIDCDTKAIAEDAKTNHIDQVLVVKNNPVYGGSGGAIPVITSGSPARMALHEYLHTLGLCDEYKYTAAEAVTYCKNQGPNLVIIEPKVGGYVSDDEARSLHMSSIPWGEAIIPQTKITTTSNLGTGPVNVTVASTPNSTDVPSKIGAPIGLYEGKTCENAVPAVHTWQPGGENTIMDNLYYGLGAGNELMVAKALKERGATFKADGIQPAYSFMNVREDLKRVAKPSDGSVRSQKVSAGGGISK